MEKEETKTKKEVAFEEYKKSLKLMFCYRKWYLYEKYMERKTEKASSDDICRLVETMNEGMWNVMQNYGIDEKNICLNEITEVK